MEDLPFSQKLLAGTGASAAAAVFVTPLDVVKTRMQTSSRPAEFSGTFDAFRKILRHEGIRQLWRGALPTFWSALPSVAVYMASYEQIKLGMQGKYSWLDPVLPAVSGSIARSISVALVAPIELVRTRMQAQSPLLARETCMECLEVCCSTTGVHNCSSPGAWAIMSESVRSSGFASLWRGLVPTLARDIPFSAVYWIFVERIRDGVKEHVERKKIEDSSNSSSNSNNSLYQQQDTNSSLFMINVVAGGVSGLVAAVITHPFDVIKTRVQLLKAGGRKKSATIMGCAQDVVKEHGLLGLTKGMVPRAVKAMPSCALVLVSYEIIKRYLMQN